MRSISLLPLAALASAFVVPDPEIFSVFKEDEQSNHGSVRDWMPTKESLHHTADVLGAAISNGFSRTQHAAEETREAIFESEMMTDEDEIFVEETGIFDGPPRGPPHHGDDKPPFWKRPFGKGPGKKHGKKKHGKKSHHKSKHHGIFHKSNLTIYQMISKSNYTSKFAELVDEYPDIVEMLNSTSANYTLFAPVNSAFEHLPKHKKPSKEFVEKVLAYHIGLGFYPAGRVLVTHTLPSAYNESGLNGEAQRLRTSVGILSGVRVNFFSKVIAVDIFAKNGVIHGVNKLIIPPAPAGKEISLFPSEFSTFTLAATVTNFTDFLSTLTFNGGTYFLPTNRAFTGLGPRANAFLFNTEKGKGYLKALLKYHIVANETLYSDAYYSATGAADADEAGYEQESAGYFQVEFPTLLAGKNVLIDVARWGGLIRMKVNGYVPVVVQDALASDGVIQVVGKVLIPPHGKKGDDEEMVKEIGKLEGEIEVADLMERLSPFVKEEDVVIDAEDQTVVEL